MTAIGCCLTIGFPVHWCARCGTIRPCDNEAVAPADAQLHYERKRDAVPDL